jgi:prepilin-type N-terminal cleavage/methylation domain-containing protein
MKRSRKNSRGFTLIEVLVTIVLMSVVLPVAMHGISIALNAADVAHHTSEAASLGAAKMNELIATGAITETQGDFGTDWPAYAWSMQSNARDFGVTELVMTITWNGRDGQRSLNISSMILPPATTG